tara:strand:- start:1090 stop:1854 length:765 start_codon:yes stop_codon:yes gene_type:complete
VPQSQNLAQKYLKNSSMDFFPKLIEEKKFSNVMRNLTIFVEERNDNGELKGIYIKEQLGDGEYKIIIANTGMLIQDSDGFKFKLKRGKITNIDKKGSFNLGFNETSYNLSKLTAKTRKYVKINETQSLTLISCLVKYFNKRKDKDFRCVEANSFLLKDIYEETFKRFINPIYIVIISLVSSLVILKTKSNILQNYYKFLLFVLGFIVILFSELSHKLLISDIYIEIFSLLLPTIFIIFFYSYILIKSKFNLRYL